MIRTIFIYFISISKIFSRKDLMPFLKKEFKNIAQSSNVLNIGSGGTINKLLRKYSLENQFKITNFDIDEKTKPDIKGDICLYKFSKNKIYDAIVIAEVLEHLHSPHLAIENIKKILKPKGKLILTTPFILPIHERPYDYYRYTKYGLKYLLRDFSNISIRERNSWTETILVLWMRVIMDKKTTSRLVAPLFILIGLTLFPLYYLIGKIIRTDFITTGYTVSAEL